MKPSLVLFGCIVLISCSSTRFVASWKNEEIPVFTPQKLLVVGMTDNLTARKIFEEELKKAFLQRNLITVESGTVIEPSFTNAEKSEVEIDAMITDLTKDGFDAVVITAVNGVDDKGNYSPGYYTLANRWVRFGRYYHRYQGVYYTPDYYNEYKVYHVETSIYNINQDEAKSLVWVGSFDIVNPQTITPTVKDYITRIIAQLEKEKIISKVE